MALLEVRQGGLYCPAGDFYIDPVLPADRALITHAHADHARPGSRSYLTARPGEALLRARLGDDAAIQSEPYGASVTVGEVRVSFHPSGHILGSSQIRLEHGGEVWVVSGDYKLAPDPTCAPFEPVRCHTFVTESTFGLPIFRWARSGGDHGARSTRGGARIARRGAPASCSPTRSARRSACWPRSIPTSGPLVCFEGVERINAVYRAAGVALPRPAEATDYSQALIVALRQSAGFDLGAALRSVGLDGVRVGLDAHSRSAPPPFARPRLRHQRPCRLAGAARRHRADRRGNRLGDARVSRPAWCAGCASTARQAVAVELTLPATEAPGEEAAE